MSDDHNNDNGNDTSISRRQLGGLVAAIGAASALSSVAGAQQAGTPQARVRASDVERPVPPFPQQLQPWPGLASQMEPRPDHGETSYRGTGRLAGRRALITGGDSGLGRAVAIAYAREGADVAIGYLPEEESDAREVIELIRQEGRKAIPLPGDIREERFCERLVATAVRKLGGLDILVNSAGRQKAVPSLAELTTEDFDWTIKTNMYAPFWITKAALPSMPDGSAIIVTSSVVALNAPALFFDYSQTKAALIAFAQSLAKQLASRKIRVNSVMPGPYWTPLQISGGQTPERITNFGSTTAFGRPGQPAEIASVYVQLAVEEDSYTSGMNYESHGGGYV